MAELISAAAYCDGVCVSLRACSGQLPSPPALPPTAILSLSSLVSPPFPSLRPTAAQAQGPFLSIPPPPSPLVNPNGQFSGPSPMPPHLFVDACVSEANWLVALGCDAQCVHVMGLLHKHVHQRGLAMVQRTNNLQEQRGGTWWGAQTNREGISELVALGGNAQCVHVVGLLHKHVHQCGLAMVQRTNNLQRQRK